jgi:hypothetical protein
MMKNRVDTSLPEGRRPSRRSRRLGAIALLALLSQAGCGREFYREWANQDVSEAVYEKSRDPRFRIDLFSIDPPVDARFADPYDPDRPPAPPDDPVARYLSPAPQNPDFQLVVPLEGTGYLKILDQGKKYESPPKAVPKTSKPATRPSTSPPPSTGPSPFAPGSNPPGTPATTPMSGNSGPNGNKMTPTSLAKAARPASKPGGDSGVRQAALQDPSQPMPTQAPPLPPARTTNPRDPLQTPRLPQDPMPIDSNLAEPVNPRQIRPDQTPDQYRQGEEKGSSLAGLFVPDNIPFDEAIAGGYASGSRPYVLTMEDAFRLAIVNGRYYQTQLENVYINALPVTLQRFSFQPQFIAGLSPTTGVGGAGTTSPAGGGLLPTVSPANSFLYNTRGTGSQVSTLNIGTVAGVGKLFDNGSKILASFASQVVFNFVGKNPLQPTVKSFIPIQAVVPFLRGGGRAVTLEALTQAERNLLYAVRSFAKFRQEYVVSTLAGGTIITFGTNVVTQGFTTPGNIDPVIGFLNVVEDVQLVENDVKNVAVFERFAEVYEELVQGESSGLSNLQLDQVRQGVQQARLQLLNDRRQYRNDLDQYKIQLGFPPDVPLIIDRTRTKGFKAIFEEIDDWQRKDQRELSQLDGIVARLPKLDDLVLNGRSCQEVFDDPDESGLENLLLEAERIALENRLDLMNARGQLYDAWRQLRVTANALKGVFTVAVTNQYLTPPTTNNPFGFVDQAKQFSLVLNAELPLVRVNERNNFRQALINYQRQRRTLQNTEDFLKYQLRNEIRQMQFNYLQYQVSKRNLILSVRTKDQAFETIIAPPQPGAGGSQGAVQTTNLINFQQSVISNENNLVTIWYNYQTQRLQVYRDLGTLPYDEWEAFDELFPPEGSGGRYNASRDVERNDGSAVTRVSASAAQVGRR